MASASHAMPASRPWPVSALLALRTTGWAEGTTAGACFGFGLAGRGQGEDTGTKGLPGDAVSKFVLRPRQHPKVRRPPWIASLRHINTPGVRAKGSGTAAGGGVGGGVKGCSRDVPRLVGDGVELQRLDAVDGRGSRGQVHLVGEEQNGHTLLDLCAHEAGSASGVGGADRLCLLAPQRTHATV
eukprot:scaffold322_cov109-Isochrysis_galbana.AAC.4